MQVAGVGGQCQWSYSTLDLCMLPYKFDRQDVPAGATVARMLMVIINHQLIGPEP